MTYEIYEAELRKRLARESWQNARSKDGEAYALLKAAARDKELKIEEWQKLNDLFYGKEARKA